MNSPKALGWTLFASVGLNVFLLGTLLGQNWEGKPLVSSQPVTTELRSLDGTPPGDPQPERSPRRHTMEEDEGDPPRPRGRSGPPELRLLRAVATAMGGRDDPRVRQVLLSHREERHEIHEKVRTAHEAVKSAILADPFVAEELAQALRDLSAQISIAQRDAQDHVVTLVEQMTPQERERFKEQSRRKERQNDHRAPHQLPHRPGRGDERSGAREESGPAN